MVIEQGILNKIWKKSTAYLMNKYEYTPQEHSRGIGRVAKEMTYLNLANKNQRLRWA